MVDYINTEIKKNLQGMAETIGKDESKYWYFAGKVEGLSLLKKRVEDEDKINSPFWIDCKESLKILRNAPHIHAKINVNDIREAKTFNEKYDVSSLYPQTFVQQGRSFQKSGYSNQLKEELRNNNLFHFVEKGNSFDEKG